jgi:hypothetical protein
MLRIQQRSRIAGKGVHAGKKAPGPLSRLLAAAMGAAALVGVLVFAFVAFIAITATGLVIGTYLWWRTRDLRRRMRERPPGGRVIEGEATREPSH